MRKRSSTPDADENTAAFAVVNRLAKPQVHKNPAAVALGRLGGKKGGPARARKLDQKRRTAIARKAAVARWKSRKTK